jgi:hypothetical protein
LDYRDKFKQAYPMTFENVGLSEDGFEFAEDGGSRILSHGITFPAGTPYTLETIVKWYGEPPSDFVLPFGNYLVSSDTFYYYNPNDDYFRYRSANNVVAIANSNSSDVFDGTSHNVTWVIDDSNNVSVFVDGVKNGDTTNVINSTMTINGYGDGYDSRPEFSWVGWIQSASIYNRALTPQEVSDRYNQSTFLFLNDTPTPTQQAYLDWQNSRVIGRSR